MPKEQASEPPKRLESFTGLQIYILDLISYLHHVFVLKNLSK